MSVNRPESPSDRTSGTFRTLDADLGDDLSGQSESVKRVCIATPDISGPVKNGGIGTAYHHLARLLAAGGHEVVIAYVNRNAGNVELMAKTAACYAEFGITFEPIVPRPASKSELAQVAAPTWALYDWLRARTRPFDLVHVSDWHGLGYGPLLAKSLGLAFGETHFVVHGHGPALWNAEGNRQLVSTERELGWVFMERRSVELADTVVCGSAHLLQWMREAGYALPARSFVWPNPFPAPDPSPAAVAERVARDGARLEEVVFFGRLEPRKGLVLFVDAIDRLVRRGRAPAQVTFLGGLSARIDGPRLIRNAAQSWPMDVQVFTGFGAEEAVTYLSQPGRLAVLPSLQENSSLAVTECLQAGIPFIAAATGGTPELVAPEDRVRTLVAPDHIALGERIADLAGAPLRAVRPRWDFKRSHEVWLRWHARTTPFEVTAERFVARKRAANVETPLVTVCIVHHERPELVRMAVDSVYAQDYPALEAVLVDDGSEGAEAVAALDVIETEFGARGWRLVRQENRYLGAARNTGAATAQGEWLLFLDDDNVLFPDAVSRLVRAARFSGADCVPAASIRFFGDGDPRTDPDSHGSPIRFLGDARAWNRFANVIGDACALLRRDAFEMVGGFTEAYGITLEDIELFNRLILRGFKVEPAPDPVYFYRVRPASMISMMKDRRLAETCRFRALAPYLAGRSGEERAYAAYAAAQAGKRPRAVASPPARKRRNGHDASLAHRGLRIELGRLEVGILLDSQWLDRARRRSPAPVLELRRNGHVLARASVPDDGGAVRFAAGTGPHAAGALYSVHDVFSGELLAGVLTPALPQARRVQGAVENRPHPQVRGWVLDPVEPGRSRRVAIHVDGRLAEVVTADERRNDIARWKGTDGRHGFLWRVPKAVAEGDEVRIEVFDAETGRPLRGSPVRLEGGQVIAGAKPETADRGPVHVS